MVEISQNKIQQKIGYIPFVRNIRSRTTIGLFLVVLSAALSARILGKGRIEIIVLINLIAWIVAVFLTDKYVHKYPQRYFTYLIASHLKAAIIMAVFLLISVSIVGTADAPYKAIWNGIFFFIFLDLLISVPRRQQNPDKELAEIVESISQKDGQGKNGFEPDDPDNAPSSVDKQTLLSKIRSELDKPLSEFIEKNFHALHGEVGEIKILDDITLTNDPLEIDAVDLLILSRVRINDVRRLNRFFQYCAKKINMGGYFVGKYVPLENVKRKLKIRYPGNIYWPLFFLHFIWYRAIPKIPWLDKIYFSSKMSWLDDFYFSLTKRRNRVLSKAEVWGRLAFCGMNVIAESRGEGEIFIMAQLDSPPLQTKITSYYPVVVLEKVGLNGEIIHAHKIRTMFPFSEFIQKRIFEDHGLASTGKFSNDYRLTELGVFLRKYWLDELPQIFDWLRGDIKLVGIRATSRHFLSLYPKEFLDLYVQIKPGLIPPIFDETTNGFDQIVKIEQTYLQRYWNKPFRTDVTYLIKTFADIVFRGVRSK